VRRLDVGEDRRPDEEAVPRDLPLQHQPAFAFADTDVVAHSGAGPLVDQGTHAIARILGRPDPEAHDRVGEPLQEDVIDRVMDDRP